LSSGGAFHSSERGLTFTFNEAISLHVYCDSQEEVDYYWERLSEGGDEQAQQCGWLKDKFGISCQVVPWALLEMLSDAESKAYRRVTEAMPEMKKLDIAARKQAYKG
jgi:predicted 3-demethylubiquinone-9 3-methyltransferase (glyoxalase superfamily)